MYYIIDNMLDSMRTFFTKCLNFIQCNKLYDKSEDELLFDELWGDL